MVADVTQDRNNENSTPTPAKVPEDHPVTSLFSADNERARALDCVLKAANCRYSRAVSCQRNCYEGSAPHRRVRKKGQTVDAVRPDEHRITVVDETGRQIFDYTYSVEWSL